jgi:hypothetical protein
MMRTIAAMSLSIFVGSVGAQQEMELRGNNYACDNPSKMNLWDISRDSELVRHAMLQKDYCWKTIPGLRVTVIEHVGRFSHVQHAGNGVAFYAYRSDLRTPQPPREEKAVPEKMVERRAVRFVKVANTSEYGVTLIRNRPTVSVVVDAGGGLVVDFTIRKDKLESGFESTVSNQRGDAVQVGGKCQGVMLGLDSGDEFTVKVLAVDKARRIAEFEIGGTWNKCNRASALSYRLLPSKFKVEGRSFDELIREHTAKEMQKTIS